MAEGAHCGRLHGWTIVAHDGGQYSPAYSVHNLLREDASVFSTSEGKKEDVTVVLRHEAGPFTLTGVGVTVPLVGFTSPLRHAAIFTSWDLPGPSSVPAGWARVTCESEWHDRVEAHHLQQRQEALQLLHATRCPPSSAHQGQPPPQPCSSPTPAAAAAPASATSRLPHGAAAGRTLATLCALQLLSRHPRPHSTIAAAAATAATAAEPHPGASAQAWGTLLTALALGEGPAALRTPHATTAHAAQQAWRCRAALQLCGALARLARSGALAAEPPARPRAIPAARCSGSGAGVASAAPPPLRSEDDVAGASLASSVAVDDAPSSLELSVASSSSSRDADHGGLSAGVVAQQQHHHEEGEEPPQRKTCSGTAQAAGDAAQGAGGGDGGCELERLRLQHLEARTSSLSMPRLPARWMVTARAAATAARPGARGARPAGVAAAAASAAGGEEQPTAAAAAPGAAELVLPPMPPAPAAWVELPPDQSHCFVPLETPMSGRYLVVKLLRGRERWGGNNLDVTHLALFGSAGPLAFAAPRCEAVA